MIVKARIHYHSDCPFFGGCENMLANFFNSQEFCEGFDLSFSYRYSRAYAEGFCKRVKGHLPVHPLRLPDPLDVRVFFDGFSPLISRIACWMATLPILVMQIAILYRFFWEKAPDVLHINNGGYPAALSARAAAIAGRLAGVDKIIMVVNNMAVDYHRLSRRFDYPFDRLVVRSVDRFITGSEAASRRLSAVLWLPEQKVLSIHNGIAMRTETESLDETRRRLGIEGFDGVVFGVVALLIPRKGHRVLLEAVKSIVAQRGIGTGVVKILIEGDGPLRRELVDFVEQNGLQAYVSFVGQETNVVNFMTALDVLILPSVEAEDFPNVVLEAMALGKPVIASRLAGTPEQVVDGETGYLVEPRSVSGLVKAIERTIDEPSARIAMGLAAEQRFQNNFTDSIALKKYCTMYHKLMGEGRRTDA